MKILMNFFLFLFLLNGMSLQAVNNCDTLPESLLGNWINTSNQEWEYGFFENFAIYYSDFWDYKTIEKRGRSLHIVLEKDGQEVDLSIRQKKEKPLIITANRQKGQQYTFYEKGFLPYRMPDTLRFGEPNIAFNSVTILGYYRNLDRIKPEFKDTWGRYEVEIDCDGLFDRDRIKVYAPIDSLGRFRLKIPVYAPQEISLDWGKLWKSFVVVPGETMMLYLDMSEFQPLGDEKNNRSAYWDRNKDILFMGKNARLHHEMVYCPRYFEMRDMYQLSKKSGSHMEYLRMAEADYLDYMKTFALFHRQYPTLSQRCVQVVTAGAKYRFGSILMQNRFNARKNNFFGFDDPAYIEYVDRHFSVNSILYYFLFSDYKSFVRDYVGYHNDITYRYVEGVGMCKSFRDQYAKALKKLNEQGKLKEKDQEDVKQYIALLNTLQQDNEAFSLLSESEKKLLGKYDNLRHEPGILDMMNCLQKEDDLFLYDTLISCRPLRELLVAANFAEGLERERVPLSPDELNLLKEKVSIAELRKPVLELQEQYELLARKNIRYPQSLINTDHLNAIKDADSLWAALMAPYHGKVILLDFWGTWCGPCKEMMRRLAPLKQDFEDQEVIFMYFACASPEDSWRNVIKEMDLSGKNIVHYNLPAGQQDLIQKRMKVKSWPTYFLIDREGKVTNEQIPYPVDVNRLREIIKRILINKK